MSDTDFSLWGMIVVPVGLAICFGPALLFWLREELQADDADNPKSEQDRKV